ncbi:MAG: LapA family protein [candidate division WOR-3 bacterium]
MTTIRLIFGLFIFFFLLFIFLQNAEERVNLYLLKYSFNDIPLFWVIFFSFLAGSIFVILLAIYQEIKFRWRLFRKDIEISNLKKEINELRKMIAEETGYKEVSPEESEKRENFSEEE